MTRTREENAADLAHEAEHPETQYHVSLSYSTMGESPEDAVTVMFSAMTGPGAMVAEVHDSSGHVRDIDGDELVRLAREGMGEKPRRIALVFSCNEHGESLTVHRTIEEAMAKKCEDFETEEKPGSPEWEDEWLAVYQNSGWYAWEVETLDLDTLELGPVTRSMIDWAKVCELVGWEDEDEAEEPLTDDEKLDAIRARIDGEWDNENLKVIGELGNTVEDIIRILNFDPTPPVRRTTLDFEEQSARMIAAIKEKKDAQADQ